MEKMFFKFTKSYLCGTYFFFSSETKMLVGAPKNLYQDF